MLITRLAKILISLSLALFCLLVAFDNITDDGTNYAAVQHVLSMDTTFPGNKLMYRAIQYLRCTMITGFPLARE